MGSEGKSTEVSRKILVSDKWSEPGLQVYPYSLLALTMTMKGGDIWSCSSHIVSIRQKSKVGQPTSWGDTVKAVKSPGLN